MFAEVVFALPFRKAFTYEIPSELKKFVKEGVRVVAPFGKRTLTGFVVKVSKTTQVQEEIKQIREVLDDEPIFNKTLLKFYEWISEYYLCSLGEALKLLVPHGTEVESKRKISIDKNFVQQLIQKEKKTSTLRYKILQELSTREQITFSALQKAVGKKKYLFPHQKPGRRRRSYNN